MKPINLLAFIVGFSFFIDVSAAMAAGDHAIQATPAVIKFKVTAEHAHDAQAFTQGLETWGQGYFLETTGLYGKSEIRKVEIATGKVVAVKALDPKYFGEGMTRVGQEILQLTWREGVILKWAFESKVKNHAFKLAGTAPWSGEGWGITKGQGVLWISNGTNELSEVDLKSLKVKRTVKVTLSGQPMDRLNELEFIDGKIFANIWMTTTIARIDPKTGNIDGLMDLSSLVPSGLSPDAVANGIAWDPSKKRMYVTGKLWPKVFELELK